jgi:Protein of unknown function (DUF2442)
MKLTSLNSKRTGGLRPPIRRSGKSLRWVNSPVWRLNEARYAGGYRVWLKFNDGLQGDVDLANEIYGEIFEPLKDPAYFASFKVDWTLVWPNGADFAPEVLYEKVKQGTSARRQRTGLLR